MPFSVFIVILIQIYGEVIKISHHKNFAVNYFQKCLTDM